MAFRVAFGVLMAFSVVRFWARGWIDELYVQPAYVFHYWGFAWVKPGGELGMHLVFAAVFVAALLVAVGVWYRFAAVTFFVLFAYVELLDATNYLNHYYFVTLVAGLMVFMPLGGRPRTVPAWVPLALRAQLVLVYFFAGLAKLDADWLLHAQPLKIWLEARAEILPGGLLGWDPLAHLMAVAGAAFDLAIGPMLLNQRTRRFAYVAVVGFHLCTGLLFNIGMFPWIMIAATTIFFDPSWPNALLGRGGAGRALEHPKRSRFLPWCLGVFFAFQIAIPLRFVVYPPDVGWHEQGYRYAWRVMLVEKTGMVEYRVHDPLTGRRWRINPAHELTLQQTKMAAVSPEFILQYAHHLAEAFQGRGVAQVEVRADAWVSINGRPSHRLIDPTVDLAREADSLRAYDFVLPSPRIGAQ